MDFESVSDYMVDFGEWLLDTGFPTIGKCLLVFMLSPILVPLFLFYGIGRLVVWITQIIRRYLRMICPIDRVAHLRKTAEGYRRTGDLDLARQCIELAEYFEQKGTENAPTQATDESTITETSSSSYPEEC